MNTDYLTDCFLISMPGLQDDNFSRTVTYVCEHNENGAMGIVVNRPGNLQLRDILSQLALKVPAHLAETTIYSGGPVNTERGFVLHNGPRSYDSTLHVSEHIFVTTSRDILTNLSRDEGPKEFIIALGYAGWQPGQLEREIRDNAWLWVKANKDVLFQTQPEKRLDAAVGLLGINLSQLASECGHA